MRHLVEMALICGRKRQSSQTGYIHHWHHSQGEEAHLTIPVVENLLFILALLRSRTAENINEAKTLLDALLHFQNRSGEGMAVGNFPIYLHEYPICKDRFTSIHAGVPIYWILKLFHQVLGRDLKQRLEGAFEVLLKHMQATVSEQGAPYPIAVKSASLAKAGGLLLGWDDLAEAGRRQLEQLCASTDRTSWYCPSSLGIMLSGLGMAYPRLSEGLWADFWKHLENTWHRQTCSYIGPAFKERQHGYEPQVTLYDLFAGFFGGGFSSRAKEDNIVHLEAVLIPANDDFFAVPQYPLIIEGICDEEKWHLYHGPQMSYCDIGKSSVINRIGDKGFHTLRLVWGDSARVHTLVCQGCDDRAIRFTPVAGGLDIFFELARPLETEDREKNREIMFFVDIHEGLDIKVSDHKATTFALDETVSMHSQGCALSLKFQLQEGQGRFMGHCMLGNRPSQLKLKGKERHQAYDWQIFLRTMERSSPCIVKVSLQGLMP